MKRILTVVLSLYILNLLSAQATLVANVGTTANNDRSICGLDPNSTTWNPDPVMTGPSVTGVRATNPYQWQSCPGDCRTVGTFSNIAGATAQNYNAPANLASSTSYRRLAFNSSNAVINTSSVLYYNVSVLASMTSVGFVGNSCLQDDTLVMTSNLVGVSPFQFSWQTATATGLTTNTCSATATCGTYSAVYTSNAGTVIHGSGNTGIFSASSAGWSFRPPSANCKRMTYVDTVGREVRCKILGSVVETNWTIIPDQTSSTVFNAGTNNYGNTLVLASQATAPFVVGSVPTNVNLFTVLTGENTTAGTWTVVGASGNQTDALNNVINAPFGTVTYTPSATAPTGATLNVAANHAHYIKVKFVAEGPSCCSFNRDSSFILISLIRTLPIHVSYFDAHMKDANNALLRWQALGLNQDGKFEIERKIEGEADFKMVGKMAFDANHPSDFEYLDRLPASVSIAYYRIKKYDSQGEFDYTTIKKVNRNIVRTVDLYPNVTSKVMNLDVQNSLDTKAAAQIKIFDLTGKQYQNQTIHLNKGYNTYPVNVEALHSGSYFMQVVEPNNKINQTFRFIKKD